MGDNNITLWHKGHMFDSFRHPKRPAALVVSSLLLILMLDWLLAIAVNSPQTGEQPLESPHDVTQVLARMKDSPKGTQPWLLIGDSVLAGDVMAGKVEGWQEKRVLDYLRRERSPESTAKFDQVALDGMLPVDIVRVLRELDRVDPSGRVAVALEINPRYFSPAYQQITGCTREWLNQLSPSYVRGGKIAKLALIKDLFLNAGEWLGRHMPIYRHARKLTAKPVIQHDEEFTGAAAKAGKGPDESDRLQARARILEHYRQPQFDESSAQIGAMHEIQRRLSTGPRRACIFNTPLNDDFVNLAMADTDYADYTARVAALMGGKNPDRISVLNMDHPLFVAPWFLDHCHMRPEGNRALAINLLHELNAGMNESPDRGAIIFPEGIDDPMVWRIGQGYSNGAPWQALFNEPEGVELTDSGRVVIADTKNHCLRVMDGNRQTVRLLAGTPLQSGGDDGRALAAKFDLPTSIVSLGETIFVADGAGTRLRKLENGAVLTEFTVEGPAWLRIKTIRKAGGLLYLLDNGTRIIEYNPVVRRTRLAAESIEGTSIRTFDVAPDGRIWIANDSNQILRGRVDPAKTLKVGLGTGDVEPWFRNEGQSILPPRVDFPMPFEKVKFSRLVDLRYVSRYDGVLIRDEVSFTIVDGGTPDPPWKKILEEERITERISLRFLRTADNLIYPWIKANVYGKYFIDNAHTNSQTTSFHLGSMAFDQKTCSMYYLERKRSRLSRYGDGIWGAAREGNGISEGTADVQPGVKCAQQMLSTLQPDHYLHERDERIPRKGPYVGVFFCTSMMGVSDVVPMYSGARVLERHLRDMLGYKDGIRFDLISRITYGMKVREAADIFESHVNSGMKADVAFIEIFSDEHQQPWNVLPNSPNGEPWNNGYEYLEKISRAAKKYDTKVIFIDHSGLIGQPGDGLRAPQKNIPAFFKMAREAGFLVIGENDDLLRDHLDITPWGSPPFWKWHAAPWAIDATMLQDAKRLYPYLRELFDGRVPAVDRPDAPEGGPDGVMLAQALKDQRIIPQDLGLFPIDLKAMHKSYADRRLEVFVDLSAIPAYKTDPSDATRLRVALSVLQQLLAASGAEARSVEVDLTLATFTNYDEYGLGVRDSAKIVEKKTMRYDALAEYLKAAREKLSPTPVPTPTPATTPAAAAPK